MSKLVRRNNLSGRTKHVGQKNKTSRFATIARKPLRNPGIDVAIQTGNGNGIDAEVCFLPLLFGLWNGYRALRGFERGGFGGSGGGSSGFIGRNGGFGGLNWMNPSQWIGGWPFGFGNGIGGLGSVFGVPQGNNGTHDGSNTGSKGLDGFSGLGGNWPFMF